MYDALLHEDFVRRLEQPVEGDTPLMLAIRAGRAGALLLPEDSDLSARNARGETALYLALQVGDLALVERLVAARAPDAEFFSDERFPGDEYALLNRLGTATPQVEVERLLSIAPPRDNMHPVTFAGLQRLRSAGAARVEEHYPRARWLQPLSPREAARQTLALTALRTTGVAPLGTVLSPDDIASIRDALAAQAVYAGHVLGHTDGRPRALDEIARVGGQGCYSAATALDAPGLLEIANDPTILAIVSEYFGFTPTISSVNLYWSFPHDRADGQIFSTESMHRDYDDYCQVALFIHLSDVDTGAGPHRYVRRTHTLDAAVDRLAGRLSPEAAPFVARDLFRSVLDGHGRMGLIEELFAKDIIDITGPAGTAFLTDVYGFHRALPPRRSPRLFAWFRYGMALRSGRSFTEPRDVMAGRYDPYINRLLPELRNTGMPDQPAENRPPEVRLLIDGYQQTQYNLCEFAGDFYAVHRGEGAFDIAKIRGGGTAYPVFAGSSVDEVVAKINSHLEADAASARSGAVA